MEEWFVDVCHLCVVSLCSPSRMRTASVVFDFNASLNDVAPLSPIQLSVDLMKMEKSLLLMDAIYVLFLLSSLHRLSFVIVLFVFNASLNDVAPLSLILFPVDFMRIGKSGLLMGAICASFLLYSQLRSSSVSVAFVFNASLNDVAAVSLMLLSVDLMRMENSGLLIDAICVLFFCLHTRD